ncbi:hypothetical protein D4Q76_01690 [archaeon]|nr:MAG: hypothetical protein D4Q76_01690 [archaeon]
MRHTLKWSFFIGTAAAGAVLVLMKLFQPIRFEHLAVFGYAFVGTSLIVGYVVHKNLEKRNLGKANAVAKTGGGSAGFIGVQRVKIGSDGMKDNPKKEEKIVPDFVPASELLDNMNELENKISDAEGGAAAARPSPENAAENGRHQAAEKFLDEIEKEEVEKEIQKAEGNAAGNSEQQRAGGADNNFLRHRGRRAKIFTKDMKTISGKFAGMDTHVVLEDALCDSEKKMFLMISKSEIARMEIE